MSRRLFPVEACRESDGTTLLALSRRDVPLLSIALRCPRRQPPDNPALPHLVADLLAEGPEGTAPLEWHRRLDRHAISISVDARPGDWHARAEFLADDLETAMPLLQEWLARPGLPRSEWKRIVREHRARAKEQWAQPAHVIQPFSAVQVLGYGHPNAHPAAAKDCARARLADAQSLGQGALHRGEGAYAAIGGDIEAQGGFDHLRELLESVPPAGAAPPAVWEPQPADRRVWLLDHDDISQAFLALGRPGVRAGDPERVALRLANYSLGGGGFSSRLMARVRADMGHTYGIHSHLAERPALGTFTIQTFTQVANLEAMLDLIDGELDAVASDGFNDQEVADARSHLHGNMPLRLTRPSAVLDVAARGLAAGLRLDDLEAERQAYLNATLDEVNAAARRLIGDGAFHLALIGPADDLRPRLTGRGEPARFPFRSHPADWG